MRKLNFSRIIVIFLTTYQNHELVLLFYNLVIESKSKLLSMKTIIVIVKSGIIQNQNRPAFLKTDLQTYII